MFSLAFVPVVVYFLLEFVRKTPVNENQANKGSNFLIGSAFMWMLLLPLLLYLMQAKKDDHVFWICVGTAVGLIGVCIRWQAIGALGRFYSRNVGIQQEHRLVQTGWYKYIRHPGYLGTFLTFIGFAVSTGLWVAVLINLIIFFIAYGYRIRIEEREMTAQFGGDYEAYRRKTWRLIPFVY